MRVCRGTNTKFKLPCFIVGVCHLVLIGFSIYERIWELIELEEPFHIQDHTIVLISNLAQVLSIFLLLIGSITGNPYYLLPWLICTAPLFFSATLYAVLYVSQEETSQMVVNFVTVGVIWWIWYIVIKFHMENRTRARSSVYVSTVKMNCIYKFLQSNNKNKIYYIALLHFVMVCCGIYSLVNEMIDLEEPVGNHDIIYIAMHYSIHFVLILSLLIGAYKDNPYLFIPWLATTFFVFFYVMFLTLVSLKDTKLYNIPIYLMNFLYLSVCWYCWYMVYRYLRESYIGKGCTYKDLHKSCLQTND